MPSSFRRESICLTFARRLNLPADATLPPDSQRVTSVHLSNWQFCSLWRSVLSNIVRHLHWQLRICGRFRMRSTQLPSVACRLPLHHHCCFLFASSTVHLGRMSAAIHQLDFALHVNHPSPDHFIRNAAASTPIICNHHRRREFPGVMRGPGF